MDERTKKPTSTRRQFLAQVGRTGLLSAPLLLGARRAMGQVPGPPSNLRLATPSRALLSANDFAYLGAFLLPSSAGGADAEWGRGFTHRYVNGQLRFLAGAWNPQTIYEMTPPALAASPAIAQTATVLKTWGAVAQTDLYPIGGILHGIYWDPVDQRLYWAGGSVYNTTSNYDPSVGYAVLNDADGTFARSGIWGFNNYSCKMAMGGLTPIPQWFSDVYCPGYRLGAGCGGYFSIVTTGPVSMGPALTAFNPSSFASTASGRSVPHKPLVNYPYNAAAYTSPDRGHRDIDYHTEFDAWNPRSGIGYWAWTDTLWQSCVWIDTPAKSGLVYFPVLGNGRVWYQNSTLNAERGSHAWHVYDPADLGLVAQGTSRPYQIQPKNSWSVQYPGVTYPLAGWSDDPPQVISGATFDQTTQRLYVAVRFATGFHANSPQVVYAYQVL